MKMKTIYLMILGMMLAVIGAQAEEHEEHEGHDRGAEEADHDEGAIKLSPEVLKEFGIELATATGGTLAVETVLPGEVQINQDRLAHVVPRYPGVVLDVKKNIGDPVETGDIMAILEGNDSLTPYPLRAMISGVVDALPKGSVDGSQRADRHNLWWRAYGISARFDRLR